MIYILQRLRQIVSKLTRRNIFLMLLLGFIVIAICVLGVYYFEKDVNEDLATLWDSIWWIIVTLTTIGYGDKVPITIGGQIIAIFGMIVGVGLLATLLGGLANYIFNFMNRRKKGMQNINSKDHIIICGWNNEEVPNVIREIIADSPNSKIVLIANLEEHPIMDLAQVSFIKGLPIDKKILEKANIKESRAALVFAENSADTESDAKTVLTVMNIESLNANVFTCAELVSESNRRYLERAQCDSIINVSRFGSNMMVQSIQDRGIANVVSQLVSNREGNTFYKIKLPEKYSGKSIKDLNNILNNIILVGFERDKKIQINPNNSTLLNSGDELYVIAYERPQL